MVIELDKRHMKFDGDLLLTTTCPVECDFCVYSCTASKESWKWMPEKTIRRVAEEYSKNNISIRISGGEPFYDLGNLERCIDILLEYYKPYNILIISSGFWAYDEKNTKKNLELVKRKGLDRIIISTDVFHAKRIPLKNVENFVKVGKGLGLEPVIRITLSGMPEKMMDELIKIIVKYQPKIELHEMGLVGRAEKLSESFGLSNVKMTDEDFNKRMDLFISKFQKLARKNNIPADIDLYHTYAAKRCQVEEALDFFPTTFPNGNVYGCSMAMKLSYMGNINNDSLAMMISKFKKTIPGVIVFRESRCSNIHRYLSPLDTEKCDFCKDQPFTDKGWGSEYLGRKFIRANRKNLSSIPKKYDSGHDLLVSFDVKQNQDNGEKIIEMLKELKKRKIRFKISNALPPCFFRSNWSKLVKEFNIPNNCYECHELFSVEDGNVILCPNVYHKKGLEFNQVKDRNDIFERFVTFHNKLKLNKRCISCIYFKRKQCNGICFRGS